LQSNDFLVLLLLVKLDRTLYLALPATFFAPLDVLRTWEKDPKDYKGQSRDEGEQASAWMAKTIQDTHRPPWPVFTCSECVNIPGFMSLPIVFGYSRSQAVV